MIAIYIRVSSHSQTAESQRVDIQRWLDAHDYQVDQVVWFEDQETGRLLKRPAFEQLQQAIFRGEARTVVVWKLDRLARSMRDGINILTDWCERGVRLISITQQLDLSGTIGHLVAGVLFAIAEIELQHTKERQAAGIAVAKAKGVYAGRKKGTTKAKPERAKDLQDQGLSPKEIASALNVSERTVFRYLAS